MAEKRESSSRSSSVKLVYPTSFVSLLICITALVRVEIVNQRVYKVEDLVAEVRRQTAKREHLDDVVKPRHTERARSLSGSDLKENSGWKDAREGNVTISR